MTRRNLELALLCIAAPFVIVLFAMLAMNEGQVLGFKALEVPICLFIAFVIAHVATRFLAPGADPAILPITFALSGIGIAFVTRLAPNLAEGQVMCRLHFAAVADCPGPWPRDLRQPHLAAYRVVLVPAGRDREDRDRPVLGGLSG